MKRTKLLLLNVFLYLVGMMLCCTPSFAAEPAWTVVPDVAALSDLQQAITDAGTTPTSIQLSADVTLEGTALFIPINAIIKLTGAGQYKIDAAQLSQVIKISPGATLYLQDITITGGVSPDKGGGIYNSGELNLQSGCLITGNTASNSMSNEGGGGVYNDSNAIFNMTDGKISGNNAGCAGGLLSYGTFTMTGGEISDNNGNYDCGGVKVYSGVFTMSDGIISGNKAVASSSGLTIGRYGGGVYIVGSGTFNMSGGEISNNSADVNGGGVYNDAGIFNMSDNAVIKNNTVKNYGGGVWGKITMTGGEISGNKATSGAGIYGENLTISGGTIFGNTASSNGGGIYGNGTISGEVSIKNNTAVNGGGIYTFGGIDTNFFTITGGEISGNTATKDGGGVWIAYANLANLNVSEGVTFTDNKAALSYAIVPADQATYDAHIHTDIFTQPFTNGYNNYDISYITYVPVTNIDITIPKQVTVGIPQMLSTNSNTVSIYPSNATNQSIVWSVKDAGTTGAYFSTSANLFTTASGTVIITATIKNGASQTTDYTQDFTFSSVQGEFIPVADITDVPATAIVGTPLALTGTVVPDNATDQIQNVLWIVHNPGTTSATITFGSNILNTTAAGTVSVTAILANPTAGGVYFTQDYIITVSSATPTVTDVLVSPATVDVEQGATAQFNASVTGTNNPAQTVTWSVDGTDNAETIISESGMLTVAADETAATLTVTATSTEDATKFGTATVTVTPVPVLTYGLSIGTFTGGSVTADKAAYEENESVTLTIFPQTGYVLDDISAYKTDEPETTVILSGSDNTRTFNMPAYEITVTATFINPDQEAVNAAEALIEAASFTVEQATANTEPDVITWLVGQINALPEMSDTGITVAESDITIDSFAEATTNGADGSFAFTVSLSKGSSQTTASTTGTITATVVPIPTYSLNIVTFTGGSVTSDKAVYEENELVSLTIYPQTGYELDAISAYKTNEAATTVILSGTDNTRTFYMPAYDVTVTASFKKTQDQLDQEAVDEAKAVVEGGTYSIAQATGNTEASVRDWLVNTLNELFGYSYDIQFRSARSIVGDVAITALTPAVTSTENSPEGVNGSFAFTVTLTKGSASFTTPEISGIILATPFVAVKSIELTLSDHLTVNIINTGNAATGYLTLALSGTNADVFTLPGVTVTGLAVGEETSITLTTPADLEAGTYKATLTISGEGLTAVSVEITYTKSATGIDNPQEKTLKAWIQNGTIHVSGLSEGKIWRIFSLTGKLIYQGVAASEVETWHAGSLQAHGIYIVSSEKETVKLAY